MDSRLIISSHSACSVTTGGNLWRSKHSTNTIYCESFCASKASQQKRKTQMEYNVLRFQQPSLNHHYKCIEGRSIYQECNRKYVVKAVPKSSSDVEPSTKECNRKYVVKAVPKSSFDVDPPTDSIKNLLAAFYKFSYPYAIIAITLCALSSSLLAVEKLSDISPSFFIGVLQAVVPQLFIEIYVSAVNQLFDFEIDKINKPYLPLASGQLSFTTVVIIAASCLTLSFWLSWIIGSWPLIWNAVLTILIWTAYSINVPLLRWKKHPLFAAMCIVSTWGFVLPITFFLHMQTFVLKRPVVFPRSLIFAIVFLNIYSLGIALAKDIPDIEGDKAYGINTFSICLGQKRVFWICVSLFEMAFGVSILAGATSSYLCIKIIMGLGNAVLALVLWYQAKSIDLSNKASIRSFYMLNWKLLYVAYFLMALIR